MAKKPASAAFGGGVHHCLTDKGDEVADTYLHWKQTLDNFITILGAQANTEEKQYMVLCNYVSPSIYTTIKGETKFSEAVKILNGLFVKTKNTNFARFCLSTRSQTEAESLIISYGQTTVVPL